MFLFLSCIVFVCKTLGNWLHMGNSLLKFPLSVSFILNKPTEC